MGSSVLRHGKWSDWGVQRKVECLVVPAYAGGKGVEMEAWGALRVVCSSPVRFCALFKLRLLLQHKTIKLRNWFAAGVALCHSGAGPVVRVSDVRACYGERQGMTRDGSMGRRDDVLIRGAIGTNLA